MLVQSIYLRTVVFNLVGRIIMKEVNLSIAVEQIHDIFSEYEHNRLEILSAIEYNWDIPNTSLLTNRIGQDRCHR